MHLDEPGENLMNNHCTDRDLLALEPGLFLDAWPDCQRRLAGDSAQLNGASFTFASGGFSTMLQPGMVITCTTTLVPQTLPLEVVAIVSDTVLAVSLPRPELTDSPACHVADGAVSFFVASYLMQIQAAQDQLLERLRRQTDSAAPIGDDFAESPCFRRSVALAALAAIFAARASNAGPNDANWIKAGYYRGLAQAELAGVNLAAQDGTAGASRSLGNIHLRRA